MIPFITVNKDKIIILGEPQNLEALGSMLILKSKLGKHMKCVFSDGVNTPIEIISSDDLPYMDE
jgi:hypothetical protein